MMFAVDSNSDVIRSSPPAQPSRSPFDDVTARAHVTPFTEMSDVEESWRTLAQLHAAAAAVQSNWNQELLRTATVAAAFRSTLNDTLQHDVMSVSNTTCATSSNSSSSSSSNNNNNNNAVTRPKTIARESTSTLKAWLLEHIKNPYPSKGEKIMLAVMTRMTLTQVSTWFANARRRLKKDERVHWRDEDEEEEEERDAEGPEEDYSSDCMEKENTELDAECRAVGSHARKSNENKRNCSEADDKPLTSSLTSSLPPNTPRPPTPSPVTAPQPSVPAQSSFFPSSPATNCFPFPVATPGISPLHIQRLFQFSVFAAAARCRDVTTLPPTPLSPAAVHPRVDSPPTGINCHRASTKPKIWSIVDLVSTDNNNNSSSCMTNDDVSINGRYERSRTDRFSSGDSDISVDDL